jgi:hypothetical protein
MLLIIPLVNVDTDKQIQNTNFTAVRLIIMYQAMLITDKYYTIALVNNKLFVICTA